MTFRPGQNLILAAGVLAILFVGSFFWRPWIFVPLVGLIGLAAAADTERRRVARQLAKLDVQRRLPLVAGRDREFVSTLLVSNTGDADVSVEVRDVFPGECLPMIEICSETIVAGDTCELNLSIRIPERGRYEFGPVWIRVSGSRRLIEIQKSFECAGSIRILPETFASWEELAKDAKAVVELLDKASRAKHHGTGTEFESLHVFRDGDDPRRIDWRATARLRQPIVRRFQIERHRDVMILIDCGRLMGSQTDTGSKLDCAVDAALNLCRVALQSGDRCGVAAYDSRVRGFLPPVTGIQSLNSIVECVYDLKTNFQETDFGQIHAELQLRQSKRSLVIVLSDVSDRETSRLQCAALQQLSKRHLVLFVALRTPLLDRLIDEPIENVIDGARHAVTFRLLRERSQTLHVLERTGVHVLDVEPHQVTIPLINQFVDLRQRNLL